MKHFIAMNGSYGCLPDACYVLRTRKDAVDTLADSLELSKRQKAELRQTGSVNCTRSQGADYCEVTECSCSTPWIHDEMATEGEWTNESEDNAHTDTEA